MKISIEDLNGYEFENQRLCYNGETGNYLDVRISLSPLNVIYAVGKTGEEYTDLESAINRFNELERLALQEDITIDLLLRDGEVIGDTGLYDKHFEDLENEYYRRMRIVKYENSFWVCKEQISVNKKTSEEGSSCSFYELK